MKPGLAKRSVVIAGKKTSVSLEEEFWMAIQAIAKDRAIGLSELVTQIDRANEQPNLSSALRVYVLAYFRDRNLPGSGTPDSGPIAGPS